MKKRIMLLIGLLTILPAALLAMGQGRQLPVASAAGSGSLPDEEFVAYRVNGILPEAPGYPQDFIALEGVVLFSAGGAGTGRELWISDGTLAGTNVLLDINPGHNDSYPNWMTGLNGLVYFSANDGTHGSELWKSDGTVVGTMMVADICPGECGSYPGQLAVMNGQLFFSATGEDGNNVELWRSDGTAVGTALVKEIQPGSEPSHPSGLTVMNDTLFFRARDDPGPYSNEELWRSDGTEAGTYQVKDICPGACSSSPHELSALGSVLLFSAGDGVHGWELWKSDGTEAGTVMVKDIHPGPASGVTIHFSDFEPLGEHLFFTANNGNCSVFACQIWKTDGTEMGTELVTGSGSRISQLAAANDLIFYEGYAPFIGYKLWRTDGTTAGTIRLDGSQPRRLAGIGDRLFFGASDGVHGQEVWVSDGTPEGTRMIHDIVPGSQRSEPIGFVASGSRVFFNTIVTGQLWALSSEFTEVEIDIQPGDQANEIRCSDEDINVDIGILSTLDYDALKINPSTVDFEGAHELHLDRMGAAITHGTDVDGDRTRDLLFHFPIDNTGLNCQSLDGTLIGQTVDGQVVVGSDGLIFVQEPADPPPYPYPYP